MFDAPWSFFRNCRPRLRFTETTHFFFDFSKTRRDANLARSETTPHIQKKRQPDRGLDSVLGSFQNVLLEKNLELSENLELFHSHKGAY